ncbi:MAG: L-aspartate oxidase [Ktedonobacteraceae bacterium]
MGSSQTYDVAIIGAGIAGLSLALRLPASARVALFTKGQLGESNTRYAQGGVAVALGADDAPELHFQDTIAAGAGLCNEAAVRILVEQAPTAVQWLMQFGVNFDRTQSAGVHTTPDGFLLGREAAHGRWRVLHAGGDATGAEIERALIAALRQRSSITVYDDTFVSELATRDGRCSGVMALDQAGQAFTIQARATVLASGGAGGLWLHTSNPAGATADGVALAWRAGAALTDLEFMQFHPTVLVAGGASHLISEAVRGEGAYLRNHTGERFMLRYDPRAELAPRDVVARAILSEMIAEATDCQYLDLRHLAAEQMHARFPTISAICRAHGLDFASDLLPVAPAAHYCMGGVLVDDRGRTTINGLYAVGEVACTGVHGANRLASNSLLEGLVFGLRVADLLAGRAIPVSPTASSATYAYIESPVNTNGDAGAINRREAGAINRPLRDIQGELRRVMWRHVSLVRDRDGLLAAQRKLAALRRQLAAVKADEPASLISWQETSNMLHVAALVIAAALRRHESRGSHWRADYSSLDETLNGRHYVLSSQNAAELPELFKQEVIAHA